MMEKCIYGGGSTFDGKGSLVNAPTPRSTYGATLLPNNNIIYIGGANVAFNYDSKTLNIIKGSTLTLVEVYLYDTINDNWNTKVTSGKTPSSRAYFSTILDTTLYVLDLTNYNWYVPKISGKIPSPRAFHKANVIGKYMVVSFGKYTI
ncbi:hypothetical protein C1645_830336 [Glomus cerebriforme]|uniref:Kelch repeat protein n=1 Tax=Glomus cerebriforme TaxID=658196 RepID=A0A397SNW6_9GLOM|nr:hypothetical protein C1645_830336 [Glomus cerebriforme]